MYSLKKNGNLFSKQRNADVTPSDANPFEQVKQLKELLDLGAITQEKFDEKKKELLNL